MTKDLPSPELLRKLLRYEPETGKLFWRKRMPDMFSDGAKTAAHQCNAWNVKFLNKEAFTCNCRGYKVGAIFNKSYRAHRLIWAIVHGSWPINEIDHINGIKHDNSLKNLRTVSRAQNLRNIKKRKDNTSGHNGINWNKDIQKWNAKITLNNKQIHLGSYDCLSAAIIARKTAEKGHGFTERHGQ